MLTLTLFANFAARLGNEPLIFPTESTRALLAYLVLERHQPQSRRRLASLLWPDRTEEKGRRRLRQTLLRLRRTVSDTAEGVPLILATSDTLQWNAAYPTQVDLIAFEALLAQAAPFLTAEKGLAYSTARLLQAAAALYQGDLLPGFGQISNLYAERLLPWREKYRREAVRALYLLGEAYGRIGSVDQMAEMARRQLSLFPEREEAHAQLMRAYLVQGELTAVVQQYALCQQQLLDKWQISASSSTRSLFETAWQWREGKAPSVPAILHNLPPEETPVYGRLPEVEELLLRLADPGERLLTITDMSGIGKTRLVRAAAQHLVQPLPTISPLFPDGVWFVSFAEVQNDADESMAGAIIQACVMEKGKQESALTAVLRYLQNRHLLLVLDMLEHLDRAAEFIMNLLTAVPHLKIVTTSSRGLGLQG